MQPVLDGIVFGLALGLLALAFQAVYLPTRIVHLALAAVYTSAPYVAWQLTQLGVPLVGSSAIALVAGASLSLFCETANHWRLHRKGAAPGAHLISSLGIHIFSVAAISALWGTANKSLFGGYGALIDFGRVHLTRSQILQGTVAFAAVVSFYAWLRFSRVGLLLKALADDQDELALGGYDVRRLRRAAFAISGLLASLCSLLVAIDTGFDTRTGLSHLLLAIVAVIIGGRRTWLGPLVGGLILGILHAEISWHATARWADAMSYTFLAVMLIFAPYGLLGKTASRSAA